VRIDDDWCPEALEAIKDVSGNILIASLQRKYSRAECSGFDLIASCTTGTAHIEAGDVPVISLQGEREFLRDVWATAEHTWGLILALVRRIPFAHNDVVAGNWDRERWQGTELRGKTLGILGYGRVGRQVATFARAFGMKCICHIKGVDIVTVHVPLTDETRGMFSYREFGMMKKGAYFVNTSRGGLVDEEALIAALETGHLAGAALDVVAGEPYACSPALLRYAKTHSNLIITPHIAGNTLESRRKTQLFIAEKIREWQQKLRKPPEEAALSGG